jgi:hypothetical protein
VKACDKDAPLGILWRVPKVGYLLNLLRMKSEQEQMQRMIDYIILAEPSDSSPEPAHEVLAARVKAVLGRGFQPYGPPFVSAQNEYLLQTIVKYQEFETVTASDGPAPQAELVCIATP